MKSQITVLIGILSGSCGTQSNAGELDFGLLIDLPDQVTDVAIDDPMAALEVTPGTGSARILEVNRIYSSYAAGRTAAPLRFSFSNADGSVTSSTAQVGSCATVCIYPHCPAPETITEETLQISTIDFAPFDFTCVQCDGGGKRALACE